MAVEREGGSSILEVVSNQGKFIFTANFSQKEIRCGGREKERDRGVRTSGGLLSRKRD